MLVLEDFGRGLGVVEELVDLLHLLSLHVLFTLNSAQQMSRRQQLQRISARKQDSIRMLGFSAEVLNLKWSLISVIIQSDPLPEGGLWADLCQVGESFLTDSDALGLSSDLDDLKINSQKVSDF